MSTPDNIVGLIEPHDRLTPVEVERIMICVRRCKMEVDENKMRLEEKFKTYQDQATNDAILHLDNDMYVLTSALRKLDLMAHNKLVSG